MDYYLTWYKSCPHWDDVQWPWLGSIPHRSRSHETFKGQSTHACVSTITYIYIDGLPSNIYLRIFRLPIKQLVFPIFPFLSSCSVKFWSGSTYQSGWEKNKMFLKKTTAGDIAVLKNDLFILLFLLFRYCTAVWVQSDVGDAETVDRTSTVHDEVSKIIYSKSS